MVTFASLAKFLSPYNPIRGGHAPQHVRCLLDAAYQATVTSPDEPPMVDVGSLSMSLPQLCDVLWNCTDALPGEWCATLELPLGASYGDAARRLHTWAEDRFGG